jgi:hypothetical protein
VLRPERPRSKIPKKFEPPREIKSYDGKENPRNWMEDCLMAMTIQNTDELVDTCYLPPVLACTASTWIQNLLAKSINSWQDMGRDFCRVWGRRHQGCLAPPFSFGKGCGVQRTRSIQATHGHTWFFTQVEAASSVKLYVFLFLD